MIVERKEVLDTDGTAGYIELKIKSDNIIATTYFNKQNRLYISFGRGHTYSYGNITQEIYDEFEKAPSQGKFFHSKINNRAKYPFKREYNLYPTEVNEIKTIVAEKYNKLTETKIEENEESD